MKLYLLPLCLLITFSTACLAQEMRKTDDAMLLEYYQSSRFADAFDYLKKVYTEPVTNAKELSRLAYTASMGRKLAEAESFYKRMYERDTTDKSSLYNMAVVNQQRGNSFKAEGYFKKYITLDSSSISVYKQLATMMSSKGDTAKQLLYLQKANRLDSADFDVASDLSDRYVTLKRFPEAEKVLSVAIAADPENTYLLQSLLKLTSAQKKWAIAVKTGEQLLQAGDQSAFTVTKLGVAYYQTKNYRCGIEALVGLPEIFQTEVTAYFTAACYKQLKDQKNAISFLEKAIMLSISPSTNNYYSELGDSYETLKQLNKALASYQKALLYSERPLTYYFMANLYDRQLKEPKNALKYFKKYLAAKPDPAEEKEYMAYSKSRIELLTVKPSR